MSDENMSDTVDDLRPLPPEPVPARQPTSVEVAGRTHAGKVRPNNEDNFHVVQFGRYLRTLVSSLPAGHVAEEFGSPGYGYAVADGVGGHAAGEVASRMAISVLIDLVLATPDWILGRDAQLLVKVMDRSVQRFAAVNEAVIAAQSQLRLRGMGTTLSVAMSLGDDLIVTHVGDSPVYLFRNGHLHRLTRDHTMDQQWPDPTGAGARFRNVLSRAIGIPESGGAPDVCRYKLANGDRLLLCTDGLTDMVSDATIARELARDAPADAACEALVDLALANGGRDNITVVVADYRFPPQNL